MKRVPLRGQMKNIITLILLVSITFIAIHYRNKYMELAATNYELNVAIDKLESEKDDLITQLNNSTNKNSEVSNGIQNLGQFKITAYCGCTKCCGKWADGITASGTTAQAGRTLAVDPNLIPLGSSVIIDGHTYIAEDTGGAIKGNKIDMFFNTHSEALSWGVKYKNVTLVK